MRGMDKLLVPGFELSKFESICHFEFVLFLLTIKEKLEKREPKYGVVSDANAYVFLSLTLDLSVFLYETIELYELMVKGSADELKSHTFYTDLEAIRNNIHTFYKKGGYSDKSDDIVLNKLEEYKIKNKDILYPLRSDISLVFKIHNNNRFLIGCDYFISHLIYETTDLDGKKHMDYAEFLSSSLKGITSIHDESIYKLSKLKLNNYLPAIELFDYKSLDLFAISEIPDYLLFRLMLVLHNISYGLLVIDELIHKDMLDDELWLCFFTKFLAIKYDESFDNLASMVKFSQHSDQIKSWLKNIKLSTSMTSTRRFAQKLRNTIHYKTTRINSNHTINTSRDYIKALYLSNTGVNSIGEYKDEYENIHSQLKLLQSAIQNLFGLNKKYM